MSWKTALFPEQTELQLLCYSDETLAHEDNQYVSRGGVEAALDPLDDSRPKWEDLECTRHVHVLKVLEHMIEGRYILYPEYMRLSMVPEGKGKPPRTVWHA